MRTSTRLVSLLAIVALAACGGGGGVGSSTGGATPPVSSGNSLTPQSASEHAIDGTNAMGEPMKTVTEFNSSITAQSVRITTLGAATQGVSGAGTCNNGTEFFAPDTNNDANSTESRFFYDTACTQIARDVVRIFTPNGTSETVARTEKIFAINNTTPSSVRTENVTFSNATFGANGFPVVAAGFAESQTDVLNIANARTTDSNSELVMMPSSNGTSTFCSDSAGFNATGIASLNETFGWQGGVLAGGTRTVNADGTVTWTSTHSGSTFKGSIGSLSVATGTANTACPIATPQFTIAGGTQGNTYAIPVTATYRNGLLVSLTVTNATLANGDTLNVTTNTGVSPTTNTFITGIVSSNGTQIATFNVDAFGDGTLTVTASGAQYVVTDWHVVK